MEKIPVTASAIISFSAKLEDGTSAFYEEMAGRFPDYGEQLLAFAQEGRKNKTQVVRTYQETITDALEACYSFEGLDLDQYAVETVLPENVSFADAVKLALALEEKACAFYQDVAERSKALLATIPGAFRRVAKKRNKRLLKLQSYLESA
jgi:hypothetical protein